MDEKLYDGTESTISISSRKLRDCSTIVEFLKKTGIKSSVYKNRSIRCNKNSCNCWVETGCNVKLHGLKPNLIKPLVWKPMQAMWSLKCSHLNVKDLYDGCIHEFN